MARILLYISLLIAFLFLISGYGYQWGIWSLGFGFSILRYSAYAAMAFCLISLVTIWIYRKSTVSKITYLVISAVITLIVSGSALYWQQKAQSVPPIHDITTDMVNPPEFVAMIRLREDAPNPPEYSGDETARLQRSAYPQIEPLYLDEDLQEVMDRAVMIVVNRKWELVAINRNEGRIEATEKLPWFGFRDDVVIRFTEEDEKTRVDMRSKSRIGRSDVGVNAKRIERFLNDLERAY
jgi:uncharacterized protein (DUF1499 family)